jgi:predicted GTPase
LNSEFYQINLEELQNQFPTHKIHKISAKQGIGLEELAQAIKQTTETLKSQISLNKMI